MNNSFAIQSERNSKERLYKFFTLALRRISLFTARNRAIFEGAAHTAAPFGGNVLTSRF